MSNNSDNQCSDNSNDNGIPKGSKVFETEYESKEEFDGKTIIYLKTYYEEEKDQYIRRPDYKNFDIGKYIEDGLNKIYFDLGVLNEIPGKKILKYKKLGFFEDYIHMLNNYPIGHTISIFYDRPDNNTNDQNNHVIPGLFNKSSCYLLSFKNKYKPTYSNKDLDKPNCYFIECSDGCANDRGCTVVVDIYNKEISDSIYCSYIIQKVFNNIFRN